MKLKDIELNVMFIPMASRQNTIQPVFLRRPQDFSSKLPKDSGPKFIVGDARKVISELPENFFQACITSPPYWGLRNYEAEDQIGFELEPEDYVRDLTAVFSEVRRVLRPDGVFWLNIGDSYTSGNRKYRDSDKKLPQRGMGFRAPTPKGWKDKELVGIPWMLAKALQRDGWYLRADIIWYKPNCMPESVKDRVTRSHEYVFMLAKSERYYYDFAAAKEENGRNWRTVWAINTEPCSVAHFATYPKELVRRCLSASTKPGDWVLDPFAGSGTTMLVSHQNQRNSLGIELNPEYKKVIVERFEIESRGKVKGAKKSVDLQPMLPELDL